jgi:hypothetical protein
MSSLPDLVERLAALTEDHVRAASTMDARLVSELARQRADLQFELKVQLRARPELDDAAKARTRAATEHLARAERRFERVVGHVLRAFPAARPKPPPTYGRTGRLGR